MPRSRPRGRFCAGAPGDRAHHRSRARRHPARHDDRLRRLATPPPTARSARWPSASAPARSSTCWPPRRLPQPQAEVDADPLHRRARPRGHGQGPHPRHDRPDGHGRRRGPRGGVRRRRRSQGFSMEQPDDDVQHDHRGRRPGGHDRPRRHDLRVGPRPSAAPRRDFDAALACWRHAAPPTRARASTARSPSTPRRP